MPGTNLPDKSPKRLSRKPLKFINMPTKFKKNNNKVEDNMKILNRSAS